MMEHGDDRLKDVAQQVCRSQGQYEILVGGAMNVKHVAEQVVDEVERVGDHVNVVPGVLSSLLCSKRERFVDGLLDEAAGCHRRRDGIANLVPANVEKRRRTYG